MNARTFDPLFFDRIDEGFTADQIDDVEDDFTLVERCPICGETNLVFEADLMILVDLDGKPHKCPPID